MTDRKAPPPTPDPMTVEWHPRKKKWVAECRWSYTMRAVADTPGRAADELALFAKQFDRVFTQMNQGMQDDGLVEPDPDEPVLSTTEPCNVDWCPNDAIEGKVHCAEHGPLTAPNAATEEG